MLALPLTNLHAKNFCSSMVVGLILDLYVPAKKIFRTAYLIGQMLSLSWFLLSLMILYVWNFSAPTRRCSAKAKLTADSVDPKRDLMESIRGFSGDLRMVSLPICSYTIFETSSIRTIMRPGRKRMRNEAWLAGPQTWLARPQDWLDDPEGGRDVQTNKKSPQLGPLPKKAR